ncbi:MAG: extracellular solute-binding protein [Anaerolineaceae bacterium]|nr:extracellular solute-binding protein [Anaerolineaceae bacterium]
MKRKLFSLIAIVMIAAMVLSACTTPATETKEPVVDGAVDWSTVTPAKNITFWHQHTGSAREEAMAKIINDFNATNEYGITLTAEYAGGYGDIYTKMLALLNTPDVPDIVVGYQNQIATYQLADAMFDMNTVINDPDYGMPQADQDDFIDAFFQQDVYPLYDNQRLGLAPNRSMEVLYYNMDWLKELGFDAPPATPEEFRAMACKAAEQPFSGAKAEGSMGYQLSIDTSRFASWTYAFGGDIYDGTANEYTLNSPAAVAAFEFLQDLFEDGCARLVSENYGDQSDFGNGTLLFTVGSSSGLPYYTQAVDEGAAFDWSVAALPSTGTPKQDVYGASVSIPKSTPERELAAWIFIKYYTSPEVQKLWAEASGYFPVRKSVADMMSDYMAANPTYKASWDLLEYGWFEPAVPGYDFVRDEIEVVMAAVVDNPSLDVQTEFDKLNQFGNRILAEQLEQIAE